MNEKKHVPTVEELRQRLGPVDELQIRLLLRVSPAQRILTMLEAQEDFISSWYQRLRKSYPNISNLELCYLMFKRLKGSESYGSSIIS